MMRDRGFFAEVTTAVAPGTPSSSGIETGLPLTAAHIVAQ